MVLVAFAAFVAWMTPTRMLLVEKSRDAASHDVAKQAEHSSTKRAGRTDLRAWCEVAREPRKLTLGHLPFQWIVETGLR